ncbi:MAG: hypothetical protein DWP98_10185 [Bacteroidetes bacterium]|nr:MAG: hypothetical protein DWP98_10185 [Bacteroidota bacterium]
MHNLILKKLRKDKKTTPKRILKILGTNYIHLIGFIITTYFSSIIFSLLKLERYTNEFTIDSLIVWVFTVPLLIFTYGLIFLGGFYLSIIIMDSIGFFLFPNQTRRILLIEWLIIIPPFVYWAFQYDYWLWLTLSVSFLITQLIREKIINK